MYVRPVQLARSQISLKLNVSETLTMLNVWLRSVIGKLKFLRLMEIVKTVISASSQTMLLINVLRRSTIHNAFSKFVTGPLKSFVKVCVNNAQSVLIQIFHRPHASQNKIMKNACIELVIGILKCLLKKDNARNVQPAGKPHGIEVNATKTITLTIIALQDPHHNFQNLNVMYVKHQTLQV